MITGTNTTRLSIIKKSINRNKKDNCSDNDHDNKYGVESHNDNNYNNVLDIIKTIELEPGLLSSWLDYKYNIASGKGSIPGQA